MPSVEDSTGSKIYKHTHDAARLLASIEREARKLGADIKTTDTRLDRLFVCNKEG